MIDCNDYYDFALIADEGSYSQAALRAGVLEIGIKPTNGCAGRSALAYGLFSVLRRAGRRRQASSSPSTSGAGGEGNGQSGGDGRPAKAHRECWRVSAPASWRHGSVSLSVSLLPVGPGEVQLPGN
ncbi:hypothetical protein ACNKHW_18215 [Shigella flexneri]